MSATATAPYPTPHARLRRPPPATRTAITKRCCARTVGGPSRTPPRTCMPHLVPGTAVLDVGCGPGTITLDFADRVAPGRVIGIDVAAAAIEAAEAERRTAAHRNVEFRDRRPLRARVPRRRVRHRARAPGAATPRPIRSARCARCGACANPAASSPRATATTRAFTWYPGGTRARRVARDVRHRRARQPRRADAGRFLLAWAHAAGFTDVQPGASAWCYATPDDRTWWGELWADRITESAIADAGRRDRRRDRGASSQTMADAWRRWAAEPDGWFAVLHGEILARA